MSSGFFGFFAHTGVMSVLEAEGLQPKRLSGSSAGALVAALWSAGLSTDRMRDELLALERAHFWDPSPGLGVLRGKLFLEKLKTLLPVETFERCRAPVAVSVFDLMGRRTSVINSGAIAPAVVASCAVPLMFHPVWIDRRPYADGGIADRHGLAGMPSGERVLYHHLASRSPWRRPGSPSLALPASPQVTSLVIEQMPRVNPFALQKGRLAFEHAARAARAALSRPVSGGAVRLAG